MDAPLMSNKKFKAKDRVVRVAQTSPQGVVREIRLELENSGLNLDARERGAMIGVSWDNGTFSYAAPESLELIEE